MATTETKVTNPPKRYSFVDLEKLWVKAGGSTYLAPVMAAIALAESGGNPMATHRNNDGSVDRGLWQINSVHKYGTQSFNVEKNAKQAVGIYHSQGLNAWSTFKNGAYKKYLDQAMGKGSGARADRFLKQHPTASGLSKASTDWVSAVGHSAGIGSGPGIVSKATGSITGPINSLEDAVMLGLKEGMYAMAILGGGMLVLLGLLFIGVDLGLSGLSSRASNHPAVRIVNAGSSRVSRGGGGMQESTGTESGGDLPGPEA